MSMSKTVAPTAMMARETSSWRNSSGESGACCAAAKPNGAAPC